ncbi:YxiJ family protein [Brevibacillus porteri]|uniref:YxiJ family protein n=1 Tax=Brevibacillus porteri TaxID=2126350 RepID=UPI00363CFBC7
MMTRKDCIRELSVLYEGELSNPFPYEDTKKMEKEWGEHFSALPEEHCFNADFSYYCSVIAGTISYIVKGKAMNIPKGQIDYIRKSFFEVSPQYCFIKESLGKYPKLFNEYTSNEQARKLILDFISYDKE